MPKTDDRNICLLLVTGINNLCLLFSCLILLRGMHRVFNLKNWLNSFCNFFVWPVQLSLHKASVKHRLPAYPPQTAVDSHVKYDSERTAVQPVKSLVIPLLQKVWVHRPEEKKNDNKMALDAKKIKVLLFTRTVRKLKWMSEPKMKKTKRQ